MQSPDPTFLQQVELLSSPGDAIVVFVVIAAIVIVALVASVARRAI